MPNMLDYLKWRGDLSLLSVPFCEPDNLILSYLAYVNLDDIAPAAGCPFISVKEASDRFFAQHSQEELKNDRSFIHMAPYVMKEMAQTCRFSGALIGNYVNIIEADSSMQFAAMEICLEDDTSYIAFRGTDDTIVGWKEDFNLSNGIVPAQTKAAEYLNKTGSACGHPLRVGGHSKGGNLCIYAAAKCDRAVQEKIMTVYCNDGPGFMKDFFADSGYQFIKDKICRIVPECSIIGMLLMHETMPRVISSSQKGILQHDGMSWEIMGGTFVQKQCLNPKAQAFNEILDSWIADMEKDKREVLISNLFSVLEVTGAQTLTELQKGSMRNIRQMMEQIVHLDAGTRGIVDDLISSLFVHFKDFL